MALNWHRLGVVVAVVMLACLMTWLTALIWPPPHPFW
jgi:hypothetical protein